MNDNTAGKIKVVLFDMFNTLANNSTEFWSDEFEKLVKQYNISVGAEEFWNIWREGDKEFSRSRIALDSGFISYLDGWTKWREGKLAKMEFWCLKERVQKKLLKMLKIFYKLK